MPCYGGAKEITIFEVFNTPSVAINFKNKVNDYGNNVEPQEAGGSLRLHNSTILGKVGHIKPCYWS